MTIKKELLNLGLDENEIDSHCSDLYVLKNDISTKWVSEYEFNQNVTTFVSQIDSLVWYEIPFANVEYYSERYR